jgi:hypothetical protein
MKLHPGTKVSIDRLGMDELGVAQAIATGDLSSPQRYINMTLYAMRVTGTGMAYRKSLNEFVWRDSELYLNQRFLDRCNGLPLVWEHPKKATLDSDEFAGRIIGTVFVPYIKGDEVWAVVKVWDDEANRLMSEGQLSTSPAVVFRDPSVNERHKLEDGAVLLEEGEPSLLDHLAVCEQGVWDKAGPPAGILNHNLPEQRADSMADEEKAAAARGDADAGEKLDKLLSHLDSFTQRMDAFHSRMDAFESEAKARKDAEEMADKARKDAAEKEEEAKKDGTGCAEGDPKGVAADKSKKDSEADDEEMEKRKEREMKADAKKDSEREKPGEEVKKDAAATSADAAELAALRSRLAALEKLTRAVPEDDRAKFADLQARADSVYMGLGSRAPAPMVGETVAAYDLRLTKGVQKHSQRWNKLDLAKLPGDALGIAREQIFVDADIAARSPDDVAYGTLREINRVDPATGQRMTTFVGRGTFIGGMKQPVRRVTNINTKAGV